MWIDFFILYLIISAIFQWIIFVLFTLLDYCFTLCLLLNLHSLSQPCIPFHWENWSSQERIFKGSPLNINFLFTSIFHLHSVPTYFPKVIIAILYVLLFNHIFLLLHCITFPFASWDIDLSVLSSSRVNSFWLFFELFPSVLFLSTPQKISNSWAYFPFYLLPISLLPFIAKLLKNFVHYRRAWYVHCLQLFFTHFLFNHSKLAFVYNISWNWCCQNHQRPVYCQV